MTSIAAPFNQRGPACYTTAWTDDWQTPPEILAPLGDFDLDPCASLNQVHPTARIMWTIQDQGFLRTWQGRVWLNPPYGKYAPFWIRRLAEHGNGIALVYSRSDTDWFHRYVFREAHALLFLRGRIAFLKPDGSRPIHNAGGPSVLIAYGADNACTLERCALPGHFVSLEQCS
jgi:hypothetical protein